MSLPFLGIIFLAEILLLFKLSRVLIGQIWKLGMYPLALLFLPGTLVHELAHLIMARLIGVHTGALSVWPKKEEGGVTLGSVAIAKTDSIRRLLIGVAPFLVGTTIILFGARLHWAIFGFICFEIGNTMFSSKKDLDGTWAAVILLAVTTAVLYFMRVSIPVNIAMQLQEILQTTVVFLLVPIGIDLVLVLISKLR